MAERIQRIVCQTQEKAGAESGRSARVRLRLVLVGQYGIEDVRTEAGLGDVSAGLLRVAEQAVEPAVGRAALAEFIYQFHMAVAARQAQAALAQEAGEVELGFGVARQAT